MHSIKHGGQGRGGEAPNNKHVRHLYLSMHQGRAGCSRWLDGSRPCLPSVHRCPYNNQTVSGDPYDAETALNGAHVFRSWRGTAAMCRMHIPVAPVGTAWQRFTAPVSQNRLSVYYPSYCTSSSTPPGRRRLTSPRYIGSLLARRSSNFFSSITNSWTSGLSAVLVTTCNETYLLLAGVGDYC